MLETPRRPQSSGKCEAVTGAQLPQGGGPQEEAWAVLPTEPPGQLCLGESCF